MITYSRLSVRKHVGVGRGVGVLSPSSEFPVGCVDFVEGLLILLLGFTLHKSAPFGLMRGQSFCHVSPVQ